MNIRTNVLVLLIISLQFQMCAENNSRSENDLGSETIKVRASQVHRKEISLPIHTSGKLSSKSEIKLSFKIGGIIDEILVDEGQTVRKGKLLAQLDQSEINAQVKQARSVYEKATRDIERVEKLYADNATSLEQKQNAATAVEIARSNLKIAEFNLQHSAIHAPTDGKILKRFMEKNELISPGMPVFIFAAVGKDWIVRVGVSDYDITRLQLGDSAAISFDAHPGVIFSATLSEIAETADPMSGTFEVELRIRESSYKLISGFIAKVDIFPSSKQKYAIIPIEALVEGNGETGFVYTIEGTMARRIPVQISHILENKIAIRTGLENIDLVVTDGAAYLKDGKNVEIVNIP